MKNGLALGAGGVKGFVHLGVLQYLKEEDIKFNVVSGSSIGSIVGAMYSLGYEPKDMLKSIMKIGLDDVQKLITYRFNPRGIAPILDELLSNATFEETILPFRAVAVNMYTGKQKNFDAGPLSMALACSSAIPPYFRPCRYNGATYVDGAFLNSVPADVVFNMGAEKILSVNLTSNNPYNYGNKKALDRFYPENNVEDANVTDECYKYSTVVIEPDLSDFKAFSFSNFDKLFEIGYSSAQEKGELLHTFKE